MILIKTEPVSIYIHYERDSKPYTEPFDHICLWKSCVLTLHLSINRSLKLAAIQIVSHDGLPSQTLIWSQARFPESSSWSQISGVVRNFLPSSQSLAGHLVTELKKVVRSSLSTDRRAHPSKISDRRLASRSAIGLSTDTESPKSRGGCPSCGKTVGSPQKQFVSVRRLLDSDTKE